MPGREKLIDPLMNQSAMLSWRSSNIDEMVSAAFAEKGPLPPK